MGLTVNSSAWSMRTQRKISGTQSTLSETFRRLSSGLRINTAADDPGRLGISVLAESQTRSLRQSIRNLNDGVSVSQTLEGGLAQLDIALQRLRELAVQASNETLSENDRAAIQAETNQIVNHMDKVVNDTHFNGIHLLDGTARSVEIFSESGQEAQGIKLDLVKVSPTEVARKAQYSSQRRGVYLSDLNNGDLKINGVSIRGTIDSDDPLSYCYSSGSAIAKARAINDNAIHTGVSARAAANVITANRTISAFTLDPTHYFSINGEKLSGFHIDDFDATGTLRSQINSVSEKTGVVATLDAQGQLVLTAEDGRNIQIHYSDMFTLIAVGLADTSGDEVNLRGDVLKSSVYPVDLFGSIQNVQSNFRSYSGGISIGGEFDRGDDYVDYVAQVIKAGGYGTAEFRIGRETNSELAPAEDYAHLDVNGPYPTSNSLNMEYFSASPEDVTNNTIGTVSATGTYNEGADRTYTITVTQEGSTDGAVKAVANISSNVDGVIHTGVTLSTTAITLGAALHQTGEFVTLSLGATPRGQSVDESGISQPYSQSITQVATAVSGVIITGTYNADIDMVKEVRVVDTGYTQGTNRAKIEVFNVVNGSATSQGPAFDIIAGSPIDIGDGLFVEFTAMDRQFNIATGSTITHTGTASSYDSNGLDVTLASTTLQFVGERGSGTYILDITEAGKTGNAKYRVLFDDGSVTQEIVGPQVLNDGPVLLADGLSFNFQASSPEIGATTATVAADALDHYGALPAYQSPNFIFQGNYTGDLNDTTVKVVVEKEGRVIGENESSKGDAALLRYTIAGTVAGATITATTYARANTIYSLGEGVEFFIASASDGTQLNVGGVDVGTSKSFGVGGILDYHGEVTLNLDQSLYDVPEDLKLVITEISPVVVGNGATVAQGTLSATLFTQGNVEITSASFSVTSGVANQIVPGLTITFDSSGFDSLDFSRDNANAPVDGGSMALEALANYNGSLGDKDYKVTFNNIIEQEIVQSANGDNLTDDVTGNDASLSGSYSGLFGDQVIKIKFDGTSQTAAKASDGANLVDDGTNIEILGTYSGLGGDKTVKVFYLGDTITPSDANFPGDTFNVQAETGAQYNGLSGDKTLEITFTGGVTSNPDVSNFSGGLTVTNTTDFSRGDVTVVGAFTSANTLHMTFGATTFFDYALSNGANTITLGTLGFAEASLVVNIGGGATIGEDFDVEFKTSQTVKVSDGNLDVTGVDVSSGKIDLGSGLFSGAGKIFADGDPGFDLDVSASTDGSANTQTLTLKGPQARVETREGATLKGSTIVDISDGIIDLTSSTFSSHHPAGSPDIKLRIANPELSEDDIWTIDLKTVETVTVTTASTVISGVGLSNTPGKTLTLSFDSFNADQKEALFGSNYDKTSSVGVSAVFESDDNQSDDIFTVTLRNKTSINIEDLSVNDGGTNYLIGTPTGVHTFDLNGILAAGFDPGFDIEITDAVQGVDDSYTLSLRQSTLSANNVEIAQLNVKSLQEDDQWSADLIADTLEVGAQYSIDVTAPHLNAGHVYEIEENIGTLKIGETFTVGPILSAYEPQVYTVNPTVAITDGIEINFNADGTYEVGDEIRFQARGYRGDYSVFGQYTDPAYPTTFEVEVTKTGDVDGGAELKVTRLDTNVVLATEVPAVSVASVGNIGGPGYLELGVFMQFDAHNGAGEAHRLYEGDKFYIDVVGSLSQNFASQVILESDDNIDIEYADLNIDNSVGRLLYVGDNSDVNTPGTLDTLKSASLGVNTELSISKMDFSTQLGAEEGLRLIDGAIDRINEARTKTGAVQNRLQREITSLSEAMFQTQNYQSQIQDADFAQEVARQTKALIIQKASSQMLSEINNFGKYGLQLVQSLTKG